MQEQITNLENNIITLMNQYKVADGYHKELLRSGLSSRIEDYNTWANNWEEAGYGTLHTPYAVRINTFAEQEKLYYKKEGD